MSINYNRSEAEQRLINRNIYRLTLYPVLFGLVLLVTVLSVASLTEPSNVSQLIHEDNVKDVVDTDLVAYQSSIDTDLVEHSEELTVHLDKRANWKNAAIDGAINTFSFIAGGASGIYAVACSGTFAAAVGLTVPGGALGVLSTCSAVGAAIALTNFLSYTISAYRQDGGWHYDDESNRDKRQLEDDKVLSAHFLGLPYRELGAGLYSVKNDSHEFFTALSKRSEHGAEIADHGSLYMIVDNSPVYIGYQFIADHSHHNKSVVIDAGSEDDAIHTWLRCGDDKVCHSENVEFTGTEFVSNIEPGLQDNNTTVPLSKRTGNSYWQSYNDWGYNGGYVHDWWDWNEPNKMAKALQYSNWFISQVQPCTNDYRCYAVSSKWCLAGGMNSKRTKDSAWVGEVYLNGYGGVDGECENG